MCVTWLIHVCDMTHSCVWHDSFMCVTWLIHVWDMIHSCVWHDPFMCVTWLIHVCDMTHSCVWHDSFTCVTWLIHVCDLTRVSHYHTSEKSCLKMGHVTHMNVSSLKRDVTIHHYGEERRRHYGEEWCVSDWCPPLYFTMYSMSPKLKSATYTTYTAPSATYTQRHGARTCQ